ncbi:hypothetical protein [Bariatricus sp. HCP28S3_D3]|uniref:hypothetical protein n=1 Tax=Bariatricus sp. HCP28S3_D3 TaxID=3438901 RepID=UPI003F8AB21B
MKAENLEINAEIGEAIKMLYRELLDLRIYLLERCIEEGSSKELEVTDDMSHEYVEYLEKVLEWMKDDVSMPLRPEVIDTLMQEPAVMAVFRGRILKLEKILDELR